MPMAPLDARADLVRRRIGYWSRGWGATQATKEAAILADPEWCRLVDQELDLEPLDKDTRAIRLEISRMEHCHESFRANAEAVLAMIASLGHTRPATSVLDCGQVGEQRRVRIADYLAALRRWRDGKAGGGALDQTVAALCGAPGARKLELVGHLIEKLDDNGYSHGPDDWERTEPLINHLEHCAVYWERSLLATLKEIGTGIRSFEFNVDGGWCSCGDAPDRAQELDELLSRLDAWLRGMTSGGLPDLGEPTPVKRWLVGSLCKHIRSQEHTGRIVR